MNVIVPIAQTMGDLVGTGDSAAAAKELEASLMEFANNSDIHSDSDAEEDEGCPASERAPTPMSAGQHHHHHGNDADAMNVDLQIGSSEMGRTHVPMFSGVPKNCPVYEAYVVVVPDSDIRYNPNDPGMDDRRRGRAGDARTWGDFIHSGRNRNAAGSTKRLLFLLNRAVEVAIQSETGNPDDTPFNPSTKKTKKKGKEPDEYSSSSSDDEDADGAPPRASVPGSELPGRFKRPPGVAGAVDRNIAPNTIPVDSLKACLAEGSDTQRALNGGIPNAFVLKDDDGGSSGGTIFQKISIVLEEVLEDPGGRTIAWRWWFLVHDPRINLVRWVQWVMRESSAILEARTRMSRSATMRGQNSKALSLPFDQIDTAECYRSIQDVRKYEAVVKDYWKRRAGGLHESRRGRGQKRAREEEDSSTTTSSRHQDEDDGAASSPEASMSGFPESLRPWWIRYPTPQLGGLGMDRLGIANPRTAMHPARVFSPQVAMDIHCDGCGSAQRTLGSYKHSVLGAPPGPGRGPAVAHKLGAFARKSRTTYYRSDWLTPSKLHSLPVPVSQRRAKIIESLKEALFRGGKLTTMPLGAREAIAKEDIQSFFEVMDDHLTGPDGDVLTQAMEEEVLSLITESDIESRECMSPREEQDMLDRAQMAGSGAARAVIDALERGVEEGTIAEGLHVPGPVGSDGRAWETSPQSGPSSAAGETMLASLMATDNCAGLTMDMVRKSPLLRLRVVNAFNYRLIDYRFEQAGLIGSASHRVAIDNYRTKAMGDFWDTLMSSMEMDMAAKPGEEMRLSEPLRGALKFLLNLRPNMIPRHRQTRNKANRASAGWAAAMTAFSGIMAGFASSAGFRGSAMARSNSGGMPGGTAEQDADDEAVMNADSTVGLWSEWPTGCLNLSPKGNFRVSLHHKMINLFRVRPGAHPIIYRILLAMGTAMTYGWEVRPNQILWGNAGVGKSFVFKCMLSIAFPHQIAKMDNVTEKAWAISHDVLDQVLMFEEIPNDLLALDHRGMKEQPASTIMKGALSECMVNTTQCKVDKETGRRFEQKSCSRRMVTVVGSSNSNLEGRTAPMLDRFQKNFVAPASSVGKGKDKVPMASICNEMESEMHDPVRVSFFHQMKVAHVLCLLVEKMLEARVHPVDIDTSVCAMHFDWFFKEVHKKCRVPMVGARDQKMIRQLVRQATLRNAVHWTFFSEMAAKTRCKRRAGISDTASGAQAWDAADFDPMMLLKVLPHLWSTEEDVVDVLTSVQATYLPTTSLGVIDKVRSMYEDNPGTYRKINASKLDHATEDVARPPKRARPMPDILSDSDDDDEVGDAENDLVEDVVMDEGPSTQSAAAAADDDDNGAAVMNQVMGNHSGEDAPRTPQIIKDLNYWALSYADEQTAYMDLSQATNGTYSSTVIQSVLTQLGKAVPYKHKDLNRPEKDPVTGATLMDPAKNDDTPIYRHTLKSRPVIIETTPVQVSHGSNYVLDGRRPIQVCFLIPYLLDKHVVSVDKILEKGLSYANARERDIVTGISEAKSHNVWHAGSKDPVRVVREFLKVIHIRPNPKHVITRVNPFRRGAVTDAFVDNQRLGEDGKRLGFGSGLRETDRQLQLFLNEDLDKLVATAYWRRAGLPVDKRNYPWNMHKRVTEMITTPDGTDELGIPLSNRIPLSSTFKGKYPDDFMRAEETEVNLMNPSPNSPTTTSGGENASTRDDGPRGVMGVIDMANQEGADVGSIQRTFRANQQVLMSTWLARRGAGYTVTGEATPLAPPDPPFGLPPDVPEYDDDDDDDDDAQGYSTGPRPMELG